VADGWQGLSAVDGGVTFAAPVSEASDDEAEESGSGEHRITLRPRVLHRTLIFNTSAVRQICEMSSNVWGHNPFDLPRRCDVRQNCAIPSPAATRRCRNSMQHIAFGRGV
jgi:hypothetical protein